MPNLSYPHPVLRADSGEPDIGIGSVSDIEIGFEVSERNIRIDLSRLVTNNPVIDSLIEAGAAGWFIRAQCPGTYYRRSWATSNKNFTITLDTRDVGNTVDLGVEVCARRPIEGYRPGGIHADYAGQAFDLREGDVLASAGRTVFSVDTAFDPLSASVESIINICEGDFEYGPFEVDLDDDIIRVSLSVKDWDRYQAIRNNWTGFIHSSIVVPTLVLALPLVQKHVGQKWADRLSALRSAAEAGGINAGTDLELAQELLRGPLRRGIDDIIREMDRGES